MPCDVGAVVGGLSLYFYCCIAGDGVCELDDVVSVPCVVFCFCVV